MSTEITFAVTEVDGNIESMYLVFGEPRRCRETLRFSRSGEAADDQIILVDVDELDLPVAVQLVATLTPGDIASQPEIAVDLQAAFRAIYGFANKLVAFHRSQNDNLGKPLISESFRTAWPIARERREREAACA